jgi:FkbM family methyltransferase
MLKRLIRRSLAASGYQLTRVGPSDEEKGLREIANRKHPISTVIDIGASNGSWSLNLLHHYPGAQYLLIEANRVHEPSLLEVCRLRSNFNYILAAAGPESGQVFFDGREPFGGQASVSPSPAHQDCLPMVSVSDAVREHSLSGPFLIKFDTHGFEVPILKGCEPILSQTEIVVMEVYNFKLCNDALLFDEMVALMRGYGFRCVDLFSLMHRPLDGLLWQMDLVFARCDRPEFTCNEYR